MLVAHVDRAGDAAYQEAERRIQPQRLAEDVTRDGQAAQRLVCQRRIARLARARLGVEVDDEYAEKLGGVPRRLRRPGAVVLEIDDEDPAFDELEPPLAPAEMELPRASGQ